jgi:TraB/PrgY/gumN family
MACALTASCVAGAETTPVMTQPPASEAQLAEVLVVGKQPGPGFWRISKGDHDLWIFATLTPLPKQMIWDTTEIEKHIGQSQAVLAPPRIDPHVGFFRGLTLLSSLLRARHNPDGRTLEQVVPHDLYMRWLGLRVKYLGHSSDEKLGPMLAALDLADNALDKEGLDDDPDIWKRVETLSSRARVPIESAVLDLNIQDEKAYVRDLTQISTDRELACLRSVIEHLEKDLPSPRERANLWSLGDVARLRPLLPADEPSACFDAVMSVSRSAPRTIRSPRGSTHFGSRAPSKRCKETEVRWPWSGSTRTSPRTTALRRYPRLLRDRLHAPANGLGVLGGQWSTFRCGLRRVPPARVDCP